MAARGAPSRPCKPPTKLAEALGPSLTPRWCTPRRILLLRYKCCDRLDHTNAPLQAVAQRLRALLVAAHRVRRTPSPVARSRASHIHGASVDCVDLRRIRPS